jgi:hypothetical protein
VSGGIAPLAHQSQARMRLPPTDPHGISVVAYEVGRQAQMGAMLAVFKVITFSMFSWCRWFSCSNAAPPGGLGRWPTPPGNSGNI